MREEVARHESTAMANAQQEVVRQEIILGEDSNSDGTIWADGIAEVQSGIVDENENAFPKREELGSWSTRPPYTHDATRRKPVNHFLSVVGAILDANKVPFDWAKKWKRSHKK